jgi:hypothetical protein
LANSRGSSFFSSGGAPVIVLTTPRFTRDDGTSAKEWTQNDAARTDHFNALLRDLAAANPGTVHLVDFGSYLCPDNQCRTEIDGVRMRTDGVHFKEDDARVAAAWLAPQFRAIAQAAGDAEASKERIAQHPGHRAGHPRPRSRRLTSSRSSVVAAGSGPAPLHLAPLLLGLDPAPWRRLRGLGGPTRALDHEGAGQLGDEALEGQGAVPGLRTGLVHDDHGDRADPLDQAAPLGLGERRGGGEVEPGLGPGVGPVRVLAPRATARGEAPLDLARVDGAGAVHPQPITGGARGDGSGHDRAGPTVGRRRALTAASATRRGGGRRGTGS